MIVAYVSAQDATLCAAVRTAAGQKVTFRDPGTFDPASADPLDTVVYVAENARTIRAAYARVGTAHLLSLDATPLPTPGRMVGGVMLSSAPAAVEAPAEPEAPSLTVSSAAEPAPAAPMPGQSPSPTGRRR